MNDMSCKPATDPASEQRRIDRWSLQQARIGLARARALGLPLSTQMYRREVAMMRLRLQDRKVPQ